MKYRISVDDQAECRVESFEVEANDLATAIFRAGMRLAQNRTPTGHVHVIKAEVPAGWMEVELP